VLLNIGIDEYEGGHPTTCRMNSTVVDASAGVSLDRQREIKKTIDVLGDVLESSGQKSIRGSSGS
jgi:hypothetical protein